MSLFDNAGSKPVDKKIKPIEKNRITIEDDGFFDNIVEFEKLNSELKEIKKETDSVKKEISDIAKKKWLEIYKKDKTNPGSLLFDQSNDDGDVAEFLFVPSDKYLKVKESEVDDIRDEFGDDIIIEETTFTLDSKMVEKYGDVISKLIEESEEIEEKDKTKIIKADTTYSIKKGTVDELVEYGDVDKVFERVKPTISIRGAKVTEAKYIKDNDEIN